MARRDLSDASVLVLIAEELLDFVDEAQLDRVGCFAYSPVEGAAANALPNPVPEDVREERRARFMQTQEKISKARLKQKVGKTLTVLVDSIDNDKAVARSAADAPEIDGNVHVSSRLPLRVGDIVTVKIDRADAYDLYGTAA